VVSDAESGLVHPPGDVGWAEAIADLVTDRARRQQLGKQPRTRATERFSVATMANRTVAVYEEVVDRQIHPESRYCSAETVTNGRPGRAFS